MHTSLSEDGPGTICIDRKGIAFHMWNPTIHAALVTLIVSHYHGIMAKDKEKAFKDHLIALSRQLSRFVIDPIEDVIKDYRRVVFVLAGDLLRFPPGAFLLNGHYLAFQKTTWQIPSLWFQLYHSRKPQHGPPVEHRTTAIANPGTLREELSPRCKARLPMGGIESLTSCHRLGKASSIPTWPVIFPPLFLDIEASEQ